MARGSGSPSGGPLGYSYGSQLAYLKRQLEAMKKTGATGHDLLMYLSLTRSVKEAKDHHMNCPRVQSR